MSEILWTATQEEMRLIKRIAQRAEALMKASGGLPAGYKRLNLLMDIEATHDNGCPLKLQEWLDCPDDFSFMHDICGISRHINRQTGQLEDCFLPRFAKGQA